MLIKQHHPVNLLYFQLFLTDFPPSDEQNLETQGSITNSSSVEMMEGQEDSMFNDQHFCE